jgi:hypothetical protein
MATYRKRPVEIEAVRWTGDNWNDIEAAFGRPTDIVHDPDSHSLLIHTLEGRMRCSAGDWLIRGVQAEYYPCKNDIFLTTYESVLDVVL